MGPYRSSRLTSVGSCDMWGQMFRWATVCHAMTLDNATVDAMVSFFLQNDKLYIVVK